MKIYLWIDLWQGLTRLTNQCAWYKMSPRLWESFICYMREFTQPRVRISLCKGISVDPHGYSNYRLESDQWSPRMCPTSRSTSGWLVAAHTWPYMGYWHSSQRKWDPSRLFLSKYWLTTSPWSPRGGNGGKKVTEIELIRTIGTWLNFHNLFIGLTYFATCHNLQSVFNNLKWLGQTVTDKWSLPASW